MATTEAEAEQEVLGDPDDDVRIVHGREGPPGRGGGAPPERGDDRCFLRFAVPPHRDIITSKAGRGAPRPADDHPPQPPPTTKPPHPSRRSASASYFAATSIDALSHVTRRCDPHGAAVVHGSGDASNHPGPGHPHGRPRQGRRKRRRKLRRRAVAVVVVVVLVGVVLVAGVGRGGPAKEYSKILLRGNMNDGRRASGGAFVARSMAAALAMRAGGGDGAFFFYGDGGGGGNGDGANAGAGAGAFSSTTPSMTVTWGAHRLTRRPERGHGRWDPNIGRDVGNADAVRRIPFEPDSMAAAIGVPDDPNVTSCATASCRDVLPFVGFVRITKTASTTMLSFLNGLAPRPLLTYDHFLNYPLFFQNVARNDIRSTRGIVPACVFGGAATRVATDGQMGGNGSVVGNDDHSNATGATMLPPYAWQCPHTTYRGVVATWARGLPYLREDDDATVTPSTTTTTMSAFLQVFTVVREPTERFVSYFHYWRRIYPHWKELATPEEHRALVNGDLSGFLKLQSNQQSSLTINSAFQYRYLSDDVNEAIAMVRESPVRVLVLLNECFEASLRMLASILPHLVQDRDVDEFLRHASHPKYTQGNASIPIVLRATSEIRPVQPVPMADIRNKSRMWLHDDYLFYRASIDQFRRNLETSNVDPGLIQECYRRLERS